MFRDLRQAIVIVLIAASMATAATSVTLHEQALLSNSVVTLGDLATVVDADRQQARELASLPLLPLPAPGTTRHLRLRELQDLLAGKGVDLKSLRFDGTSQVKITASARPVGREARSHMNRHARILAGDSVASHAGKLPTARADELREQLHQLIVSHVCNESGEHSRWRVACEVAERHLELLDTAVSQPSCRGGAAPWTGRQRLVVSVETPRGFVQFPVYAELAAPSPPIVVAARPLARGTVIAAADLVLREVEDTGTSRRTAYHNLSELIGMQTKVSVQAGDMLVAEQVQAPLMIKRGELVTVYSEGAGIRVRTTAKARENGSAGEFVQLESLETRERFQACVTGLREASVSPRGETATHFGDAKWHARRL